MEEILPSLEGCWQEACTVKNFSFDIINVDQQLLKEVGPLIMKADLIVVSAFNLKVAGFLKVMRGHLNPTAPFVFYLHGLATFGLWPIDRFFDVNLLSPNDVFLGTCDGDQKCLELVLPRAKYKKISFFRSNTESVHESSGLKKDILYIGRISDQKNLTSLISAFNKLNSERGDLKLHIYGKEDFLGSPNMGIDSRDTLKELKSLASPEVIFHGFVAREEIVRTWKGEPFVFCSPSVHSDENFGMAALMAYEMGGRLVLSSWGGHKNFYERVPELTHLVDVFIGEGGLEVLEDQLISQLKGALNSSGGIKVKNSFTQDRAVSEVDELLNELEGSLKNMSKRENIKVSAFGQSCWLQKRELESKNESFGQRIFQDYDDPKALEFFRAYGAKSFKK